MRSHANENLFMEYDRVLINFSIAGKVVRLITDNASNNLSAFGDAVIQSFESYFISNVDTDDDDCELDRTNSNPSEGEHPDDDNIQNSFDKQEELLRPPCFVHTLQLVVKNGLNQSEYIRSSLGKLAEISKLSHKSITMAGKLQNENLSIPAAVITRWNSKVHMVSKILDIPNTLLNDHLSEQNISELLLSTKDLVVLRELISIFTLFAEATKYINITCWIKYSCYLL